MNADALICSHPRSGGRWLRYLIAHYLAARHRLEIAVTPQTVFAVVPDHQNVGARGYPAFQFRERHALPLLAVCHQPYSWELHQGYPIFFLARNPYDVVVSAYYHLTHAKGEYTGSRRDFTRHAKLGLPAWIEYMNLWAPQILLHRDSVRLSYRELDTNPAGALTRALTFLHEDPDPTLVQGAVDSGNALRSARDIRTGQEGNFWDHLEPDEIFSIQETLHRDLSVLAVHLLEWIGMEVDPFPRESA